MFDKNLTFVYLFVKTLTKLGQGQILDECWIKLGQILDICPKYVQHLSGHPFYKSTQISSLAFQSLASEELCLNGNRICPFFET